MKSLILFLTGWFLICARAVADDIVTPHITVFGTATIQVAPDQMIWSVAIKNKASKLQDAAKEHGETVQQVLRLLKDQKIPEAKIQTTEMEFGENREYKMNSWTQEGYFASTEISFSLDDFKKYKSLWMGLSQIANVSVQSVNYTHSRRIEYQKEARKNAIKAAREKAQGLAEASGCTIAEPLAIDEDLTVNERWGRRGAENYSNSINDTGGNNGTSDEQNAPGRIPINARVKAVFKLVSHEH